MMLILLMKTQKCLMIYPLVVFKLNICGINYHIGELQTNIAIAHYDLKERKRMYYGYSFLVGRYFLASRRHIVF